MASSRARGRDGGGEQPRTIQARAAVIRAATARFVEAGYANTSVSQIVADSGVPAATVYRLFSGKLGILTAVMDVAIAGDDVPVPVASRPVVRTAMDDPSPAGKIAGFVSIMVQINRRISDLYWVVFNAADADPGARELLRSLDGQRGRGQQQLALALADTGALRPGLSQQDGADIIHALMSPETYRLLVTQRGWSPERYADWLTAVLREQLLSGPAASDRDQ